jgi:hypothetical protein
LPGTRNVNDGNWHHVVAVYDRSIKYLYIDGVLEAQEVWAGPINLNNHPVLIGANAELADRSFNGWLDEIAIYKRPLNPDEVVEHYQAGISSVRNGLLSTRLKASGVPVVGNLAMDGSLSATGKLDVHATVGELPLGAFRFEDLAFDFTRNPGVSTATLRVGATLDTDRFTAPAAFPILASAPRFSGTISSTGEISLSANDETFKVLGYSFDELDFTLSGNTGGMGLLRLTRALPDRAVFKFLPDSPLAGTISTNGTVSLSTDVALTFGSLVATDGALSLNNADGLRASGTFRLDFEKLKGNVGFAGQISPLGTMALTNGAATQLGLDSFTFDLGVGSTLTASRFTANGKLNFGGFDLSGFLTVNNTGTISFTGTQSAVTDHIPFGVRLVSGKFVAGHPYAWLDWDASATFNGSALSTTISGTLTVEYEDRGSFVTKNFPMPAQNLFANGQVSVSTGEEFFDLLQNSYSTFSFQLPGAAKQ